MTRTTIMVCALTASMLWVDGGGAPAATIEAFDTATVQPGGPRPAPGGKDFFNIEGSANGGFASFGVVDFNLSGLGLGPVQSVENVQLQLTEANAAFSLNGPMSFYYTAAAGVDVQPGAATAFQSPNDGLASVDPALGPLVYLGSGQYDVTGNGTVETFSLNFSGDAMTGFVDAINGGSMLRLIITPDAATTAATYAGATYSNSAWHPMLTFDAISVPEPGGSAAALLMLGVAARSMARRRYGKK